MFYQSFVAYPIIPNESQIDQLKEKGYKIFENVNGLYYEK